jgi:drug/metabolite transporter (DMT)-like permease
LAACFSLMSVSYMTAMSRTTAANAIWLQATAPWWVFLFSVLLFREPIVPRDLIPLAFGAIGVALIVGYEMLGPEARGRSPFGVACGLAAGITYAGVVVCMRRLRAENSPWLVALNHGVAMLVLAPFALSLGHWPTGLQWALLAALGILQMALPYLLFLRALRSISSQEAVALGMLEPILIPVWAYLVGDEVPGPWTVAGAALILVGLTLRYVVWEGMAAAARASSPSP